MANARRDENNVTTMLWVSSTDSSVTVPLKVNPVTWRVLIENTWGTSPLTTKWDLYTYSTTDDRLPVWTDWQSLVADSSTSTWLKWSTPAWGWDMTAAVYDPATIAEQLVWLTATQTLTNKTLTSPVVNTPTWIVKWDVGLWNVDNTSDSTKNAAAATLTNKTIDLSSNTITGTTAEFNTALSDWSFATGWWTATWTNTWDQTDMSGISDTKANFDTACSDGAFVYTWDDITWKSASTDALNSATTIINVSAATAPTTWQVLTATSSTTATWQTQAWGGDMSTATYDPANIAEQLVWLTATQTLTNKTLTTPVISSISNTWTLTLPTSTDTLVWKATTDTFTNKTFDANWTWNSLSNVDVADLANGTDWELITWDATGAPATVATWTAGQVLTSNWVWAAPTFQDAGWGWSSSAPLLRWFIAWELTVWIIDWFDANWAITAWTFRISTDTLPTWSSITVDVLKNWTTDATCTITTGHSINNGRYQTTDVTFVSWSYVAWDVIEIEITAVWSTIPWSNLWYALYE